MIRKIDIIPPLTDIISCDLFDNLFYPAFLTDTRKRGCIPLQTNSKYSIFLKVAELGSMSKAAMHCNYSQSAVSQIINSLEDELPMTLLHRSQFGVVLTAEGAQILPYIKQLSDAAEAVNEQAAKLKGLEIGHVRIGTFSSVSCHVLAPVLKEFKAVYPNISIEIREDDDAGVTAMLMRNEIDFGFADAPVPRGFDSILIRREALREDGGTPGSGQMTLPEFLDSLPEGEQYAALVHLSVLWAERQGQKSGGSQ